MERDDGKERYPKPTLMTASVKLAWKQDFNPNEYCTEKELAVLDERR